MIPKSKTALERYGHRVVIGNDLNHRKREVVFVMPSGEEWVKLPSEDEQEGREIEEKIVAKLTQLHDSWIKEGSNRRSSL